MDFTLYAFSDDTLQTLHQCNLVSFEIYVIIFMLAMNHEDMI